MNIQEVSICSDCGGDVYTCISHDTVTVNCRNCDLNLWMKVKPHPELGNLVWDYQEEEE